MAAVYRGTSLIRNRPTLGPYSRTMPRLLWLSWGGEAFSYERGTPVGIHSRLSREGTADATPCLWLPITVWVSERYSPRASKGTYEDRKLRDARGL